MSPIRLKMPPIRLQMSLVLKLQHYYYYYYYYYYYLHYTYCLLFITFQLKLTKDEYFENERAVKEFYEITNLKKIKKES